jgi:mannose-6-phosphate isomerase-like protein (cupin superfamily)
MPSKVNVTQALAHITQPFMLVEVARVGELVMHAYSCQGAVQWHRHVDNEELFLVHSGWMILESEWGNVTLKQDEMTVVPKSVGHRSGSQARAVALLVQPRTDANRRNGHRRLFALPGESRLSKFNLIEVAARADLFRPEPIVDVQDLTAQVVVTDGTSPEYINELSESLWLVLNGEAHLDAEGDLMDMSPGDLTVLGRGVPHRWISSRNTVMFLLSRWAEAA